jgi:hypothetical protein
MPKFIQSAESLQYKKQLAEFMQLVNPKPTIQDLEKLKEKYRKEREGTQ